MWITEVVDYGDALQAGNPQAAVPRPGISCGLSETREHVQEQAQLIADECMASLNAGGWGSPHKSPLKSPRCVTRVSGGGWSSPGMVCIRSGSWLECGEPTELAGVGSPQPQPENVHSCRAALTAGTVRPRVSDSLQLQPARVPTSAPCALFCLR